MDFKVLHRLEAGAVVLKRRRAGWDGLVGREKSVGTKIDELSDDRIACGERDRRGANVALNRGDLTPDRGHVWPRSNCILKTHHSPYSHAGCGRNVIGGGHKVGFPFKGPGPAGVCSALLVKEISVRGEARLKAPTETDSHVLN